MITFKGKEYPTRLLTYKDNTYMLSVESLDDRLFVNGAYVSQEARLIDEGISYYVMDAQIDLPDEDLIQIIKKNSDLFND